MFMQIHTKEGDGCGDTYIHTYIDMCQSLRSYANLNNQIKSIQIKSIQFCIMQIKINTNQHIYW
jgi:hypothetical protein